MCIACLLIGILPLGGDFLLHFDERMLPHLWEIDQNFCSLVKSPPLARTPPPHGVYIDRCITSIEANN